MLRYPGKIEQLGKRRYTKQGGRAFEKRQASKAMRRAGRLLRDDAPKRQWYRGWYD